MQAKTKGNFSGEISANHHNSVVLEDSVVDTEVIDDFTRWHRSVAMEVAVADLNVFRISNVD